jgi:hypothetical protein
MIYLPELPISVKHMVQNYNAWIVGSAADPSSTIKQVKDIDVIISFSLWNKVVGLIPENATKNNYGGWKYGDNGKIIDVWPDELNHFMSSDMPKYLWQPRYNIRYVKNNY